MVERALPVVVEQWPDEDTTARGPERMTGEGKIFSRAAGWDKDEPEA
jgi:hypothetical protein